MPNHVANEVIFRGLTPEKKTEILSKLINAKGDVDFESVKNVAGYVSPVPGGVGPVTVAMLLNNVLKVAKHKSVGK